MGCFCAPCPATSVTAKMGMRTKLLLCGAVITASIAYAVYLGASSSWQYYLQVDECLGQADQFRSKRLRLSGRVAVGSLKAFPEHREANFVLEGNEHKLPVCYRGPIPDNLAEGRDVVVEGALADDGHFQSDTLITRCASKYAPKDASNQAEQAKESRTAE
jgi:cytochrome c-type biogenesis protein CcmE